jgi:predicted outer membrane protein
MDLITPKLFNMNTLSKAGLLLSLPLALLAGGCGDGGGHKGDKDTAVLTTTNTPAAMNNGKDEEFVEDMLEDNANAMAWLRAGTRMGTDAQLKNGAAAMLTDHEELDRRFRDLAAVKSYQLDDMNRADSAIDAADDKRGAGWDDDWADKMKDIHEKMTNRLTNYSDDVRDADLKALINEVLPKMNNHLAMSRALNERTRD